MRKSNDNNDYFDSFFLQVFTILLMNQFLKEAVLVFMSN